MGVKKYMLDPVEEEETLLFAIHSGMEIYRLAFLINSSLPILFKRNPDDFTVNINNQQADFTLYQYKNNKTLDVFYLVENIASYRPEKTEGLFGEETELRAYLIPEYKKTDYFFKIQTEDSNYYRKKYLPVIQSVKGVNACYEVPFETLKLKTNLIFE